VVVGSSVAKFAEKALAMSKDRNTRIASFLVRLSLLMYCASFIIPGSDLYGEIAGTSWFWGARMFLAGIAYCFFIPMTMAWWANVVFWMALSSRKPEKAGDWSLAAGSLALLFLIPAMGDPTVKSVFDVFACLPFTLWLGSMFVYAIGKTLEPKLHNPRRITQKDWEALLNNQ
jgi:hypothetical protein